jgi:hypothetical protein
MQKVGQIDPGMQGLADPLLLRLYEYWGKKRQGRTMPSRADIDPVEMAFMLGYIVLVDVLYEPLRFGIRVHGTELARRAGYDLKTLDKLPVGEFRALALQSFTATVESRAPKHSIRNRMIQGRSWRYESLILPLSRNGTLVDMLLVGLRYLP